MEDEEHKKDAIDFAIYSRVLGLNPFELLTGWLNDYGPLPDDTIGPVLHAIEKIQPAIRKWYTDEEPMYNHACNVRWGAADLYYNHVRHFVGK